MLCNTREGSQRTVWSGTLWVGGRVSAALSGRDECLQSRPFSQSRPIIQHVTKYLVKSVLLEFPGNPAKGRQSETREQEPATVESWGAPLCVSQWGCWSLFQYLTFAFYIFYTQFCPVTPQTGSISTWRCVKLFSHEGQHVSPCVSNWTPFIMRRTCVCSDIVSCSPQRPCEPQWREKNSTFSLGLRCDHY